MGQISTEEDIADRRIADAEHAVAPIQSDGVRAVKWKNLVENYISPDGDKKIAGKGFFSGRPRTAQAQLRIRLLRQRLSKKK